MSQDLFDFMSGPTTTPQQQPFQPGQFNMSAPPATNPLGGPNLSPMGFPGASNASIPQSPFSQPSPSGQIIGAFSAGSNPPSASTDQFAGLFSMQSTSSNQAAMPGALGQSASPLGQTTQQPASLFGQTGQQNASIFGQTGQQNTPTFGQTGQQNASPFGQTGQQSTSIFGQTGEQNTSPFGQTGQQTTSPFGQANQQNTSLFGQTGQQNTSPFAQTGQPTTSPFGQASQQNTSLFGQTSQQTTSPFGQPNQQNTSLFGQTGQPTTSPFGQASQQNTSLFGQTGQPTTLPFGQASQQNTSPFVQTGQPTTSPFGQQQTQQPLGLFGQPSQPGSAFGALSAPIPVSQNNSLQLGGFPSMPKTPSNTPTTGMMQSAAPDAFFGGLSTVSSGFDAGMAFPNPFAATVTDNKNNNAAAAFGSSGASDDFFAALSTPSSTTKPVSSPMSPSSSNMNDDFLDAFSSSMTLANKPAPAPASDLNFDIFSSPAKPAPNAPAASNAAPTSDSAFDPFASFAAPPRPSSTPQQQAAAEPLFDAFSSTPKAAPAVPGPTPSNNENKTQTISEPAKQPTEAPGSEVKDQEPKESKTSEDISDPVLREINEKFGGRWKLLRSDPYDEYLKSVGVGLVHRKRASTGSPEQWFEIKDGQIHITIKSSILSQYYIFKLNEETDNLVEKIPQSVFCSYSSGKLYLQMTPSGDAFGKTQEVERFINENNEHVVIHSAGIASCRRYFGKMEPLPSKGAIITPSKPADSTPDQDNTKTNGLAPGVRETTTPAQSAALQSQEVQKLSVPENTWNPTPPRAATPELVLELQSTPAKPASPITPGQMLLQNLQEMSDDQTDGSSEITDNGNMLVFSKNGTEESDA